jgi:hypothetical protein
VLPIWDSAALRIEAEVPRLTDGQLLTKLASVVAMLHDNETMVELPPGPFYALDAQWFGRGLYLLAVPASDRTLLGAQLVAVDGHPIAQVMARIGSVVDYQDAGILDALETAYLDEAHVLYWLGIAGSPSSAQFTVRTTAGRQQSVLLQAGGSGAFEATDLLFSFVPGTVHIPLPLYLHDASAPYWMDVLAGQRAVYLKYNQCLRSGDRSAWPDFLPGQSIYQLLGQERRRYPGPRQWDPAWRAAGRPYQ